MKYLIIVFFSVCLLYMACKKKEEINNPPLIIFHTGGDYTKSGDTLEIGAEIRLCVSIHAADANITNFTIKRKSNGELKTVLDSGLNSGSFTINKIYYQGIEDEAEWIFTAMDKNRLKDSTNIVIYKDPNSTFGGIYEYSSITLGMQDNTTLSQLLSVANGNTYLVSDASSHQTEMDVLTYFKYSLDNGINMPSPTFSSPGEDINGVGDLYDIYYPQLSDWTTRNHTKYDIREDNGVSILDFNSAHNDSLIIVSYDDVWGKKKYKWAVAGKIIPFQTAAGKKGLIHVEEADTVASGQITFSMKIQM